MPFNYVSPWATQTTDPSAPETGWIIYPYTDGNSEEWRTRDSSGTINVVSVKHNYTATVAPTTGDDDADGYSVGSIWVDVTADDAYMCLDNSTGAAVWGQIDGAGGGGAPTDATYIVQTANGSLSAEQALGALASGILKNTTTTGVLSIATAGTDYTTPASTETFTNKTIDADGTGNTITNIGSSEIKSEIITGLTADATPDGSVDYVMTYDDSATALKKVLLNDLPGGGGGMSSFTAAGDSGGGQAITDGNTLTIAGGTGITTTDSATDTVTIDIDSTVATLTGSQTLTNKTLTTPTVGDFTNATHDHSNAAGGGTLAASAIASGTLAHERGGLEADVSAYAGVPLISGGSTTEIKYNLTATAAPTTGDDSGDGYVVGSRWIDVTNDKEYVCLDNTSTAAVWTETTGSGGGGSITPTTYAPIDLGATFSTTSTSLVNVTGSDQSHTFTSSNAIITATVVLQGNTGPAYAQAVIQVDGVDGSTSTDIAFATGYGTVATNTFTGVSTSGSVTIRLRLKSSSGGSVSALRAGTIKYSIIEY